VRARVEGAVAPANAFHEFADGRTIAYAIRPLPDGGGVATHEDVTEQRRIEARIKHMAHHDALTDLPNRVLLRESGWKMRSREMRRWACFGWISIASKRSTTRLVTQSETRC
jgi:hypothetical protein